MKFTLFLPLNFQTQPPKNSDWQVYDEQAFFSTVERVYVNPVLENIWKRKLRKVKARNSTLKNLALIVIKGEMGISMQKDVSLT